MQKALLAAALATAFLAAPPPPARAAADEFAVNRVWFDQKSDGDAIRADLRIGRRDLLQEILRGGYRLHLTFELRFIERRDWWYDRTIGTIAWDTTLSYDALTQRYLLHRADGTVQRYSDFRHMADQISRLRAGANADREYAALLRRSDAYLRARFYLRTNKLPAPMQINLFFTRSDWHGGDNWTTMPIDLRPAP